MAAGAQPQNPYNKGFSNTIAPKLGFPTSGDLATGKSTPQGPPAQRMQNPYEHTRAKGANPLEPVQPVMGAQQAQGAQFTVKPTELTPQVASMLRSHSMMQAQQQARAGAETPEPYMPPTFKFSKGSGDPPPPPPPDGGPQASGPASAAPAPPSPGTGAPVNPYGPSGLPPGAEATNPNLPSSTDPTAGAAKTPETPPVTQPTPAAPGATSPTGNVVTPKAPVYEPGKASLPPAPVKPEGMSDQQWDFQQKSTQYLDQLAKAFDEGGEIDKGQVAALNQAFAGEEDKINQMLAEGGYGYGGGGNPAILQMALDKSNAVVAQKGKLGEAKANALFQTSQQLQQWFGQQGNWEMQQWSQKFEAQGRKMQAVTQAMEMAVKAGKVIGTPEFNQAMAGYLVSAGVDPNDPVVQAMSGKGGGKDAETDQAQEDLLSKLSGMLNETYHDETGMLAVIDAMNPATLKKLYKTPGWYDKLRATLWGEDLERFDAKMATVMGA